MVLFLQETKLPVKKMEHIRLKVGFECSFAVSSEGRSGGLALMWHKGIQISIKNYSKHHIDAMVHEDDSGRE